MKTAAAIDVVTEGPAIVAMKGLQQPALDEGVEDPVEPALAEPQPPHQVALPRAAVVLPFTPREPQQLEIRALLLRLQQLAEPVEGVEREGREGAANPDGAEQLAAEG